MSGPTKRTRRKTGPNSYVTTTRRSDGTSRTTSSTVQKTGPNSRRTTSSNVGDGRGKNVGRTTRTTNESGWVSSSLFGTVKKTRRKASSSTLSDFSSSSFGKWLSKPAPKTRSSSSSASPSYYSGASTYSSDYNPSPSPSTYSKKTNVLSTDDVTDALIRKWAFRLLCFIIMCWIIF